VVAFPPAQLLGLHSLWATGFAFALATVLISLWRPAAWPALLARPQLLWLVLASGITNATFNWGVMIGEVVRVVLLFYLMPVWSLPLARWLLGEGDHRRSGWPGRAGDRRRSRRALAPRDRAAAARFAGRLAGHRWWRELRAGERAGASAIAKHRTKRARWPCSSAASPWRLRWLPC
jgi:hypothetical protein